MERLGPYRILRTIAMGGMGEVFLAALERAGGFEKQVALKCVLPGLMEDPRFVELFEKEARLAAALTHRNIVQIFDFGQDQGRSWLAMEYVRGVDLKAVMDLVDGPLPMGLAVEIGVACARGLDYAHRARDARGKRLAVIHRDVSPQNVLLSFEGDVKLADFGLAQAAALGADENRALQGKIAYMSPEQAGGEALDGRTDQFSLGAILFELVTGHRAFFADDGAQAILSRVSEGKPLVSLDAAAPTLHPALIAVIQRAMARNRSHRFSDAGALGDALTKAAATAGVPLGVPPLGAWLRAQFPHRDAAAVPKGVDPMEATAIASEPIGNESTAVALEPISGFSDSPSLLEQTAAAVDPILGTGPFDRSENGSTPASLDAARAFVGEDAAVTMETTPAPDGRAWAPIWLLLVTLVAITAWWRLSPAPTPGPDAAVLADTLPTEDAAAADPTPLDEGVVGHDARREGPESVVDARAVVTAVNEDARVHRVERRRRRSRDAGGRAPKPSTRDAGAVVSPPSAVRDAALKRALLPDAATPKADAVAGPRARAGTDRGTVRMDGAPAGRRWRPITGRGLLIDAEGPEGPRVRTRILERGGRFVSTITAKPFGQIFVDERPMGESPKAGVPLKEGRSTISVRTADGHETRLTVELSH